MAPAEETVLELRGAQHPSEATPIQLEPLTRAAIEAASEAWWLAEPSVGALVRVRRLQLIRFASAENLEKTVRELGRTEPASDFGETTPDVIAECTNLGISTPTRSGRGPLTCDGEKLPSYTARAKEFLNAMGAPGVYAIYSGTAHAEIYAMYRSFQQTGTAGGEPRFDLQGDPELVHAAVHGVLVALVGPVTRCADLFGWDRTALDELIDFVDTEMDRLRP
jgi:hypothetical protein